MELLQPIMLWGTLAIGLPILIHLWYSRKGKPMPWAAMRWLSEKEQQPKKGLKLDHLLLLVLRILIILLVAFILSKPFLPQLEKPIESTAVHLIEPTPALVEEFRFEIEQALEKGEQVYWMSEGLQPVESLEQATELTLDRNALPGFLADQLEEDQNLHIYLQPDGQYLELPTLVSPTEVSLYVGEQDIPKEGAPFVALAGEQVLRIEEGELGQGESVPTEGELVFEGPVSYKTENLEEQEIIFVEASLQAISEVYGLTFEAAPEEADSLVNIIFTDGIPAQGKENQIAIVKNTWGPAIQPNTYFMPTKLDKDESELIRSGRLPEFILEKWTEALNLKPQLQVSKQQLERIFKTSPKESAKKEANLNAWLIMLLLFLVLGERFVAFRKGV
ncbi:BatA domain-containing protein [Litoribacter ruber]|uniref:BatA domain-containing protein n=1 Tax=Litoribacter ruber TaxID=702568 RepID=UPI001BDA0742|nr:BatA domain-containing protein [Litoribacter ruber]MBT0811539.1 BatA domain-containing protein [Litoribacter ruber]